MIGEMLSLLCKIIEIYFTLKNYLSKNVRLLSVQYSLTSEPILTKIKGNSYNSESEVYLASKNKIPISVWTIFVLFV